MRDEDQMDTSKCTAAQQVHPANRFRDRFTDHHGNLSAEISTDVRMAFQPQVPHVWSLTPCPLLKLGLSLLAVRRSVIRPMKQSALEVVSKMSRDATLTSRAVNTPLSCELGVEEHGVRGAVGTR